MEIIQKFLRLWQEIQIMWMERKLHWNEDIAGDNEFSTEESSVKYSLKTEMVFSEAPKKKREKMNVNVSLFCSLVDEGLLRL